MHCVAPAICPQDLGGNGLLGGLSQSDRAAVAPFLELVMLPEDACLFRRGDTIGHLWFPLDMVVSVGGVAGDQQPEVALVGAEGFVGWPAALGCATTAQGAAVQMRAGAAFRLRVEDSVLLCEGSPALLRMLLRFVDVAMLQVSGAIGSHAKHPSTRRVARWLLMRHDRVAGDCLNVRHDQISAHLGMRRASITDALHVLEGERLVRCNRGHITVSDRPGLEAAAGDSYGAAEARYRLLIGAFGKTAAPPCAQPGLFSGLRAVGRA